MKKLIVVLMLIAPFAFGQNPTKQKLIKTYTTFLATYTLNALILLSNPVFTRKAVTISVVAPLM